MKKRSVFMIVGGIIVIAAIAISLIFVFSGNDSNGGDITDPPAQELTLKGTWCMVANFVKDVPTPVENQYIIFSDTEVSMYKDATGEAYAKSAYTLNEANQLKLNDISKEYKLVKKSDNCIRLYDGTDAYMLLIRNSSDNRETVSVTSENIAGKWNVAMKGDELNNGDALEFAGTSLKYYKGGNTTPAATVDFTLENSILNASAMGLKMRCFKISDSTLIFVQDTGIVWELTK
jgi:hypothetical protein